MHHDLNDFIVSLDEHGWLKRVMAEVNPDLEICAITDLASKAPEGGPALLFENPTGHTIPVATNLFGSMSRVCLALGVKDLDEIAKENGMTVLEKARFKARAIDAIDRGDLIF